jgi:hypothetical protein
MDINTVVSPDDGHIVVQNMYRLINILRINCAPSGLYLQEYAGMQGQQNIKKNFIIYCVYTYFKHSLCHRNSTTNQA